jgi:hypothetical protein
MGYKTKKARFQSKEELAWKHVSTGANFERMRGDLQDTHFRRKLVRTFGRTVSKEEIKKALEIRRMVK